MSRVTLQNIPQACRSALLSYARDAFVATQCLVEFSDVQKLHAELSPRLRALENSELTAIAAEWLSTSGRDNIAVFSTMVEVNGLDEATLYAVVALVSTRGIAVLENLRQEVVDTMNIVMGLGLHATVRLSVHGSSSPSFVDATTRRIGDCAAERMETPPNVDYCFDDNTEGVIDAIELKLHADASDVFYMIAARPMYS